MDRTAAGDPIRAEAAGGREVPIGMDDTPAAGERPTREHLLLRLLRRLRPVRTAAAWVRFAGAVAILLAAFAGRLALEGVYQYPFITFFPAILAAALLFGHGAGHLVTLLGGALAFGYFVVPQQGVGALLRPDLLLAFGAYLAVGAFSASVVEATLAAVDALEDANRRLAEADAQKAVMLEDINHRLKNSLHTIGALLAADAARVADEAARAALDAAAGRLRVLARVHERLRLAPDAGQTAATVDMRDFLGALCADLRPTLADLRAAVLRCEVQEVRMPMVRAITVGLIVNELVTNAVRHAFPDSRSGTVWVRLQRRGGGQLRLEVEDDGIGAAGEGAGTGTRVVQALARQLGGTLEREPVPQGSRLVVAFPEAAPG